MDSKQAGNLYHMLYDMEQDARSTCRNCDPKEQKMKRVGCIWTSLLCKNLLNTK